ncbi:MULTISPECIES: hypothetical protein [unclassified Nonomuraea]|uniref:hypothetical protein n=1 Tax=unclassified Nonomuraea TaxID=2593643 RepID=UPI0033F0C2D7
MPDIMQLWDAELAYTHTDLHPGGVTAGPPAADGAEPLWCVYQVQPTTNLHAQHAFPHSAFEWRAAEYGFDPDDVDGLLEVILYEPYIPDLADPFARQDLVAAKILEAIRDLPGCWTPGVPEAERRAAHLERIAAVKAHRVQLQDAPRKDRAGALAFVGSRRTPPADPLAPIKTQTRLDPVRVRGRRMAVDWVRANADKLAAPTFDTKPPSTFLGAAG